MTRPTDIPEDVWEAAADAMRAQGWRAPSMIIGAAHAILAERTRIALALDEEASTTPDEQDAVVVQDCADLVRANFSYDEAEKVASIRRGTAPPSSPPEENGESATPSHAPGGRG